MKIFALLTSVLILNGCVQAQTLRPQLTKEELRQEQEIQSRMAANQSGTQTNATENVVMTERHVNQLKSVAQQVNEAGKSFCADMGKRCSFDFVLLKDGPENAYADGGKIFVTPAIIDATANNDELAFVIAHEFAHNVMGHIASSQQNVALGALAGGLADALLKSQGMNTGGKLGQMGAQYGKTRYSIGFEQEADYVGLYILARTRYNLHNAPNYWRRASLKNTKAIYSGVTHPSNSERFVQMNKTIAEIEAKKNSGQPIVPTFQEKKKANILGF